MKIHRSRPAREFVTIPNETLRDERLTFAARGQLAYLLSLPDGWHTSADDEAKRARAKRGKRGEGRSAMRAVYAELKNAGYIRLVRSANTSGQWTTETHVYDRPFTEVQVADVPESGTSVPPAETPAEDAQDGDDVWPGRTDVQETGSRFTERRSTDTPVTGTSKQKTGNRRQNDQSRVGDPIADKGQPQDQGQDHAFGDPPQTRKTGEFTMDRETTADQAPHFPHANSESATTGGNARASEANERDDFEAKRQEQLALLAEWIRNHPEPEAS